MVVVKLRMIEPGVTKSLICEPLLLNDSFTRNTSEIEQTFIRRKTNIYTFNTLSLYKTPDK